VWKCALQHHRSGSAPCPTHPKGCAVPAVLHPALQPPAPVGPHPLTAICAGTGRCHLERSKEPEGELALPRRVRGRARRCGQPRGGRAGSTANGMEPGRAVQGTAGNMGTHSKSCSRSEGEPGRWQGKEQRGGNRAGEGREERPRQGALGQESCFHLHFGHILLCSFSSTSSKTPIPTAGLPPSRLLQHGDG